MVNKEAYKEKLQDYIDYHAPIDIVKNHRAGGASKGRSYLLNGKRGFHLFDPSNQTSAGGNLTMWIDFRNNEKGDIFKFMKVYENLEFQEALQKLQGIYGKEIGEQKPTKKHRRNRYYSKGKDKPTEAELVLRTKQMEDRREMMKDKVLESLKTTGQFFSKSHEMPYAYEYGDKKAFTGINYIVANSLDCADSRFVTKEEADKYYEPKNDATLYTFEYQEHKRADRPMTQWLFYNAEDLTKIKEQSPKKPLTEAEIAYNILEMTRMCEAYYITALNKKNKEIIAEAKKKGIEPKLIKREPPIDLSKHAFRPIEALRRTVDKTVRVRFNAKIPGAHFLEQELAVLNLAQAAGMTEQPRVEGKDQIIRYLESGKNTTKKFSNALIGMDRVCINVLKRYEDKELAEKLQKQRVVAKMQKQPFKDLSIRCYTDIPLPDKTIPKGAVISGIEAYKTLAAVIDLDKKLFENKENPLYEKEIKINVRHETFRSDLIMHLGRLEAGNQTSVGKGLEYAFLEESRKDLFEPERHQEKLDERIRFKKFKDRSFAALYDKTPAHWNEQIEKDMQQEHRDLAKKLTESLEPFHLQEQAYLENHPEMNHVKDRADTYLYAVRGKSANELWKEFTPSVMIGWKHPKEYGKTFPDDAVRIVETSKPLIPTIEPGELRYRVSSERENCIAAGVFLRGIEAKREADFEQYFTVEHQRMMMDGTTQKEVMKGEEARIDLCLSMLEDRDAYSMQKEDGKKETEWAMPHRITVRYGDTVLADKTYILGTMQLGNHQSVAELLQAENSTMDPKIAMEIHTNEKYSLDRNLSDELKACVKEKQEEIDKVLAKTLEPAGSEFVAYERNAVGKTKDLEMSYVEGKALVNRHIQTDDRVNYMVEELIERHPVYSKETIQKRFDEIMPKYSKAAEKSLARPEVTRHFEELEKSKQRQVVPKKRNAGMQR